MRPPLFLDHVHRRETIPSTQEALKELFLQDAPEGTLVVAQEQTHGRGRRERPWDSQKDRGLWVSFLLRPKGAMEDWTWAPLWAGIVVRRAVLNLLKHYPLFNPERLLLKWPNDLMVDERKLGGILAQTVSNGQGQSGILLGVGVNLSQRRENFPMELQESALSIYQATGQEFVPDELLDRLQLSLDSFYPLLDPISPDLIAEIWLTHAWGLNRRFTVTEGGRETEGLFYGLGPQGELRLLMEDQTETLITSAEQIVKAETG